MVEAPSSGNGRVIGREPELATIGEFLGPDTAAPGLVLTGGPGIGKTSLWEAGVRLARQKGMRVLAARPTLLLAHAGTGLASAYTSGQNQTNQTMNNNMIAPAGGDQPHNNMQPYLTLNFCIALQGIYPPRT